MQLKKIILPVIALLLINVLSSCMMDGADTMFALPSPTEEHRNLQEKLNSVMKDGWEFAPPITGAVRTALHFADLDSDDNAEAIALLRHAKTMGLQTIIYKLSEDTGTYEEYARAVMEGESFDRLALSDMNGDGINELIFGLKFGTDAMYSASMFSCVNSGELEWLMDVKYTDLTLCEMNKKDGDELLVLQNDETGKSAVAILYGFENGDIQTLGKAPLSAGVTKPDKITCGTLMDEVPGAVVDGAYKQGGYISDVLTYYAKNLENLTFVPEAGMSEGYLRSQKVMAEDINLDGHIEIPVMRAMASPEEDPRQRCDWYQLGPNQSRQYVYSTYNDVEYGWYLHMPTAWRHVVGAAVTNTSEQGKLERKTVFYRTNVIGNADGTLLTITAYIGQNRVKSGGDEEIVIASKSDILLTAVVKDAQSAGSNLALSSETIKDSITVK